MRGEYGMIEPIVFRYTADSSWEWCFNCKRPIPPGEPVTKIRAKAPDLPDAIYCSSCESGVVG